MNRVEALFVSGTTLPSVLNTKQIREKPKSKHINKRNRCQLFGIGVALKRKLAESDRSLMTLVCAGSLLTA